MSAHLTKLALLLVFALLLTGTAFSPFTSSDASAQTRRPLLLRVTAIDVGQGDSLLITAPAGKRVLIDAGTEGSAGAVRDALRARRIDRLDLAVATHPHADHIGSMDDVVNSFAVTNFLDSGQPYTTRAELRPRRRRAPPGVEPRRPIDHARARRRE